MSAARTAPRPQQHRSQIHVTLIRRPRRARRLVSTLHARGIDAPFAIQTLTLADGVRRP